MNNSAMTIMSEFATERPVGTASNNKLLGTMETMLTEMGYAIQSFPFDCVVWQHELSTMKIDGREFVVEPSPFSEPFNGTRRLRTVKTVAELQNIDCRGDILLLSGEITETPLSPKNYPFYYPDEHKSIIDLLELKQPAAIVAVTGKTALHGKTPFPYFEDGNFLIPTANIDTEAFSKITPLLNADITTADLVINSSKKSARSRQIVASKKSEKSQGKIIIAAHMDSKYDTPGALDNAAGVAVLLEVAARVDASAFDVDIVPFNSEEYYGASGEVEYLKLLGNEKIVLMINIDSPCHKKSKTGVSFYNFSNPMQNIADGMIASNPEITMGSEWYAGDHAPFLFRGIPCVVVTSSDLFECASAYTHTPRDTLEIVDTESVNHATTFLVDFIVEMGR